MSGLFGASSAAASSSSTLGDIKNDVALSNPPSDSVSHIAFSMAQDKGDFLAVASWDNKIRIYEVAQNGQTEGRHVYEHQQPVLNCDFSKVSGRTDKQVWVLFCPNGKRPAAAIERTDANMNSRTAQKSALPELTRTSEFAISQRNKTPLLVPTTSPFVQSASSKATEAPWSSPGPGTRP